MTFQEDGRGRDCDLNMGIKSTDWHKKIETDHYGKISINKICCGGVGFRTPKPLTVCGHCFLTALLSAQAPHNTFTAFHDAHHASFKMFFSV